MKILIVNKFHYLRGGDCRYVFELADLLRKEGHEVRHFSMQHPKNVEDSYAYNFVSYIDFPQELKKKGIKSKIKVLLRSLYSREAREKFGNVLENFKPDVIHLNNIHKHLTTSIIIEANQRHIPIIWTLHDYNLICPNISFVAGNKVCEKCKKFRYIGPAIKKCSNNSFLASSLISAESILHRMQSIRRRINFFISPSVFLKNKFVEYGFEENKIKVLPNFSTGNNSEEKQIKRFSESEFPNSKYFLYMGRLSEEKGVDTLCRAAELAEVNLIIAGDGPLKDTLDLKYSSDKIKFVGYKQGEELKQLRKNAWFLVIPSEWYENNPYSVIESFNDFVPVIGSSIGGIPELVINDETGFLFESGNTMQLQAILEKTILMSKEERDKLARNAKRQILAFNNPSDYYNSLINIYQEAITQEEKKWKHLLQ